MSFHDVNQSQLCNFKKDGLGETSNFRDYDDALMRFSPNREEKLNKILNLIPHDIQPRHDQLFGIYAKEEIELSHKKQAKTITCGSNNFVLRNLELRISNVISPLLTGDNIKGIGGMPVTVTLVNSHTKERVKTGLEASGKLEIVVIKAEFNDGNNEFESQLVHHTEGKKYVLPGKLCLNLLEGTAVLPMVSFARNKRWMKISEIRLEARFVDSFNGVLVKKAQTEPFFLKDRRNEAYKKHPIPSLDDDIWRLNKVDKKGLLARSLINSEIKTVKDFIIRLFLDPQSLEKIFDGANHAKSLKTTVKHARKCPAKLKYFSSFDQKNQVVFNVSGEVLGLYLNGQFLSRDTLSQTQKEVANKLIISAFTNWEDVILVKEDQFVAHFTHLLSKSIFLDGLNLNINESCLFGSMHPDGRDPNPQFLSESLMARYNEIYRMFESDCTSNQLEPAGQKNGFCRRWRFLFCVVTFTKPKRSLDYIHAHKKPRFS